MRGRCAGALLLAVGAAIVALAGPATAGTPRCFGAAAHDPRHGCANPALRLTVLPSPDDAELTPGAPCAPLWRRSIPEVCAFGVPRTRSRTTIAVLGDSHGAHWRAAVDVMARARAWHALDLTRSTCAFTLGTPAIPEPGRSRCMAWNRATVTWLGRHPEVSIVLVSHNRGVGVLAGEGRDRATVEMAGFRAAWESLPPTVRKIVVVRDVPHNETQTMACVKHAIARRRPAGPACAVARRRALQPDRAALAVKQLRPARAQLIDLSEFFCDSRACPPVIGGVLVHKDVGHITRLFSRTLGPYLERAIAR